MIPDGIATPGVAGRDTMPTRSPAGPASPPPPLEEEINPFELVNAVLRRWRAVSGLMAAAAGLAMVYWAVTPRTYTATSAFVPEAPPQSRLPTGIAGLFGQFGISLGSEGSQSPRFYAGVLKGRELMERVLLARYADPRPRRSPGDSVTLLQLLGVRGRNLADSVQRALRRLDVLVTVQVDNPTNIVRVSVDAHYPALAADVANRFIAALNEFNAQKRQSQARVRRQFVETRMQEAERELRQAENALKTFYERNRFWQQAPEYVFEEGRLRRQVEAAQEVYTTLRREYETARIEEVNDTPVITVLEAAVPPQRPAKPHLAFLLSLALVLSGVTGVFWAAGLRYVDRLRDQRGPPYQEYLALRQQLRREVRHALAALASKLRR